ncbi:MAG: tetratricopeptide repeat protein [Bacteroidales bacterium]|nr:tetratricopeptide repeat protein [Bacteroidales bacterium]
MNKSFKYFLFVIILIAYGCSTKKNTSLTRFYHGLTTKYNILFNGTESYKEGLKTYEDSYTDDYSKILPIFIYGNEQLASSVKPGMDRTIEKSTKSIKLHSITSKPDQGKGSMSQKEKDFYNKNEYNAYIDDSYLIMGKAFFYQADYGSAIRVFDYIIKQFDDDETKYLAYNWLVRSNVELKDFREAQNLIDFLTSDMDYPEKLNYQFNLTQADFYLKQQRFSEAEPFVSEALLLVKKKKEKLRLTFIHAQLNEELNNFKQASEIYGAVIKMNPPYEMAFNAKIKRASLFTGGKSIGSIKSELLDMLKDDKNIEYQDQIYYALGELEMKDNKVNQAVEYYHLSAKTSISNTNQKALTFLALANIYFDKTAYVEAQAYFDSAVVSLDHDFPGYRELSVKNQYLSRLVINLNVVSHQDSLQMVARMSEQERNNFIKTIIQNLREKEARELEERKARELAEMQGINRTGGSRPTNTATESGKWYFYNPSAKSFGQPEFKRRWGTRKLEDNWRRKNKQVMGIEQITETEISDEIIDKKSGMDDKTPEYYMVDIPLTDSAMKVSNKMVQAALYNIGEVYRNNLKDYPLALNSYKELTERYSESEYKVPAYYSMYKVYLDQGESSQADVYKNIIIRNYPDSRYAKVLIDPDYFKQFEKEEQDRKDYYQTTLEFYKQNKFSDVITRCDFAEKEHSDNVYLSKYKYLKALATGKIYGISVLKQELEKVIAEFKDDPVSIEAERILASIQENEFKNITDINFAENQETPYQSELNKEEFAQKTAEEIEEMYTYSPDDEHCFAIVISKQSDINQLKFNIINFNLDFYIQESYDIENKEFNDFFSVITVRQFKNAEDGVGYFNKFETEREKIFKEIKSTKYQYFIITDKNLAKLADEKIVRNYLIFYNKNYKE